MENDKSYSELLKSPQWIKRRNEILTRDKNTCQFCGAQDRYLHVHHKEYIKGLMPWEYEDSYLISLCDDCHDAIHYPKTEELENIHVGDIYRYEHSDYENTCIVFYIDRKHKIIYTVEYDNGSGTDTIYTWHGTIDYFRKQYTPFDIDTESVDCMFESWFRNIAESPESVNPMFAFLYKDVIDNNKVLREILEKQ